MTAIPYLLHNPRCSKSRAALALLQERGVAVREVRYLDAAPTASEIEALLHRLGFADPRALMRSGEALYAELGLGDPALDRTALVEAMARHPRLIERPVFVRGERAIVGRPPERVLELLDEA